MTSTDPAPAADSMASDPGTPTGLRVRAAAALLIVACWAAYAVSLNGEFVFDDLSFFRDNPTVKGPLSPWSIFTSPYYEGEGYRPLVKLSFALEYRLHRLDTTGYHVTNLLIHTLNALLLWLLVGRLLGNDRIAFWCALLFAVHPVHAEPVACIVQRGAMISTLFFLLGWLAWLRGGRAGLALCAVAWLLGLLSKEDAVSLPAAIVLGEFLVGRIPDRRALFGLATRCLVFAVPLALYVAMRSHAIGNLEPARRQYFADASWLTVALTMADFTVRHYLPGMLAGVNLSCDYARPSLTDVSPDDALAWLEAAALVGTGAIAVVGFLRRRSVAAFGVVFAFLTLLPVSNLVFRIWAIGAQRYAYLPSIGVCVAIAAGLEALRGRTRAASAAGGLLAAAWLVLAALEASVWRDGLTLYPRMLERTPENVNAMHNLAGELQARGELDRARERYERAAQLDPTDPSSDVGVASVFAASGKYEEAVARLRRVVGSGVRHRVRPWVALGTALLALGRMAEAKECVEQALDLAPDTPSAWRVRGDVCRAEGDREHAESCYRRCLELNPDDAWAAQQLAALLRLRNEYRESRDVLRSIVEADPRFAAGWNDLGLSLDRLTDRAGAETAYLRAIEVAPDWGAPCQNLGMLLLDMGRAAEAEPLFVRAMALMPAMLEARVSLGIARARLGRREEAIAVWREFLELAKDVPQYAGPVRFVRQQLEKLEGPK